MEKRVHFFSIYDMSIGYNLVLAEKAIIKYQNATPSNINDVIELYHIKKLFFIILHTIYKLFIAVFLSA